MRLISYFLPRILSAALTMLGVSALVFVALRLIPGGYADVLLGPFATEEARAMIAARYGLDEPAIMQYARWLGALVQGDFGSSMVTRKPVFDEFLRRAPVTFEMAAIALAIALAIGLPLGIRSGIRGAGRQGVDSARVFGAIGSSIPDFVLGSVLIFVFSSWQLWFRVGGFVPLGEDSLANFRSIFLPSATLALFGSALILRTTRDAVLRVMTEGYITAAVARGDEPGAIVRHHILRNASIPVVTVVTTYFGFLLGGAVAMEVLFSIPGVGLFIFNGLQNRDYAIVQAGVLLAAFVFIAFSMLSDVLYAVLDPRIAAGGGR